MADPLGIIGVIAVAGHIIHLTIRLGRDMKSAPEDVKSFLNEIQTLKTVLTETRNIISNGDFKVAFESRRSALLLELGDSTQPTRTFSLAQSCKKQLDDLLSDLKKRTEGDRFGWERLKGAFVNKRTKETVQDLYRQCQTLNSLISLDALSIGLETHKEVKNARQEQQDWQNEQRSKVILDWLCEADYAAQQSDLLRRRQAGTGKRLLNSQEYQEWVATPQATLFCPGIPGAGKTMLTSIVVNDLQDRFRDDGSVSIAFLYCNFRRQTEQTVENLLSRILRQLAQYQPSLPECVQALHAANRGMKPSLDQLSSTLKVLANTLPRAFIIVDALDECQLVDGNRARFLDEILALQSGSSVNLFATSRFIMDITDLFSDVTSLEIRAHEEDVRLYLAGSISQLPACVTKNPQLQEEIMTKIVVAVDGMFLLAQLHLNSLKGKKSAKTIRTALGALHTGSGAYDKAYDDAMERIAGQLEDQQELARQVLMWITCTVRPLSLTELQEALAIELGESDLDPSNIPEIEDVLSVCAGLVTVDEQSNVIRLVHYTTQEYFTRTSDRWFPGAHCSIAEACITYLSFDMFNAASHSDSRFGQGCLGSLQEPITLFYAAEHWVDHASRPESELCNQMVSNFISRRLSSTSHKRNNTGGCWTRRSRLIRNISSSLGRDEVVYASRDGDTRHVQYLLQRGALPNAEASFGFSPLYVAADYGQSGCIRVLLECDGIDINNQCHLGQTPLFIALERGQREAVEIFLHMDGIDTTTVSHMRQTTLHAAAAGGMEDMLKLLLDMDCNKCHLNAQDRNGFTALGRAAISGHAAGVRILLERDGINIKTKDLDGSTPLHRAAQFGHREVIQMLVDFDLTAIGSKNYREETPLYMAAAEGHEDAIRVILDFDSAAINTKDESGSTPLHVAARHGHEAVIQTLLSLENIEVNARTDDGSTPLHYAAMLGNIQVLESLLNTGKLTANDEDNEGRTPIWMAVEERHTEAVKYLLSVEGVNTDRTDSRGFSLLHYAAKAGHLDMVRVLLASGHFNINQMSKAGETPLWLAVSHRYPLVVETLLDEEGIGMSLEARDSGGRTALSVATERGHASVVKLLEEAHIRFGLTYDGI